MAGQRWGERYQDPSLLLWSGGLEPLSCPSLCFCLHQINGLGMTEEVFQSALPAKIVHHPDSLLFLLAVIQGHTHVQMFIWWLFILVGLRLS